MAHWIIEDHGFGGQTYRCSNCRDAWNDLYYDDILKDSCPACGEPINEDENEYVEELKKTGIIGAWKGISLVSAPELIDWLNGKKYRTVDETSDNMSVGFESDHLWELSRNHFINDTIKHIQEMSAIEAEKIRYGEWREEEFQSYIPVEYDDSGNPMLHTYKIYRCDQCGCTRKNMYPYCNCGAKMSNYKNEKNDPTHDMKKAAMQQILLKKTIK